MTEHGLSSLKPFIENKYARDGDDGVMNFVVNYLLNVRHITNNDCTVLVETLIDTKLGKLKGLSQGHNAIFK